MIRLVLAEDEPLLRAGLRLLLEHDGDICVAGEAPEGAAALAAVRRHRPDVLLIDLRMPGVNGTDAIRRLRQDPAVDGTRALVLTTFDDDEDVLAALRAGADGYLVKDVQPEELRRSVRVVAAGQQIVAPTVLATVLRAVAGSRPRRSELLSRFSPRELDVLALVGQGLSNTEIAAELHLSPATIRTYVSRMLLSSGSSTRAQLVVLAHESGLIDNAHHGGTGPKE